MRKLLLLLALAFSGNLQAEAPPPSTQQLIEQLGSDKFAERTRAAQLLQARGPIVLPALREAREHPNPEVCRQVLKLIPLLEAAAALEPKRVSLHTEKLPLSDVLQAIQKQTGFELAADEAEAEKLCSVEIKDRLFWEALEQVRRETNSRVGRRFLENGIRLVSAEVSSPFVVVNGPFRLEATRFHEDRDIDFAQPGKDSKAGRHDHLLTLTISILAEPRFRLLAAGHPQVSEALDDDNQSLGTPGPPKRSETQLVDREIDAALRQNFAHASDVLLQRGSARAKSIRRLRGTLPVRVVVERKWVAVTEDFVKSKGTKFKLSGDTLEISRAEQDKDGGADLQIEVPPPENGVRWMWHQRVRLEDGKGNRYESNGSGNSSSGGRHWIHVSYGKPRDAKVGPPTRVVMEDWVILHHAIPFEFKDVPLP
jgi:hypothetical protein